MAVDEAQQAAAEPDTPAEAPAASLGAGVVVRAVAGGVMMGLANLVPGISGGTMLVAAGVYQRFIDAIASVTRLKLSVRTIAFLGIVVGSALAAIVAGASVVAYGLANFRWGMYSMFIGLTLGGVPLMLAMVRPMTKAAWGGLVGGVIAMAALAWLQASGAAGGAGEPGVLMFGAGGIAGASAMILPGVSGAYLLLLLGLYEPIIESLRAAKDAASDADIGGLVSQMGVVIPVGVGVVLGVVVVGNGLKFLLRHFEKATLGVLLGLLVGAPLGLYPFKRGIEPEIGDELANGTLVSEENLAEVLEDPKDWDEEAFVPGVVEIGGSLGLVAVGFGATFGVSRFGGRS